MPTEPYQAIPPDLLVRLESLRPILENSGVIQHRCESDRHPSYRLRFRIADPERGRRHHSITLKSVAIAEAVGSLLAQWRHARAERERQEPSQPAPAPDSGTPTREEPLQAMRRALVQGGWRTRRRIAAELNQVAAGGPMALYIYMLTNAHLKFARPPGRPRKARLALPCDSKGRRTFMDRLYQQHAEAAAVMTRAGQIPTA